MAEFVTGELRAGVVPTDNHLNFDRYTMPQIKLDQYPKFFSYLKDLGVGVSATVYAADRLKATQKEINAGRVAEKVAQIRGSAWTPRPFIISADLHVLDGHHQLFALRQVDPSREVPCYVVDIPMLQLVSVARGFEGATYKSVTEATSTMKKFREFVKEAEGGETETRVQQVRDAQQKAKNDFETKQRQELETARQADFKRKEQERRSDIERKQAVQSAKP